MDGIGVKSKAKGFTAEFADLENGCEKHSSGRPAEDYEFEASQRSHVLIIAPEREALTFPSMLSRLRRLSRRCVTLCREMQILRREMASLFRGVSLMHPSGLAIQKYKRSGYPTRPVDCAMVGARFDD